VNAAERLMVAYALVLRPAGSCWPRAFSHARAVVLGERKFIVLNPRAECRRSIWYLVAEVSGIFCPLAPFFLGHRPCLKDL